MEDFLARLIYGIFFTLFAIDVGLLVYGELKGMLLFLLAVIGVI